MKNAMDKIRFGETPEDTGRKQCVAEKRPHKLLVVEDDPVLVGIYREAFTTGFEVLVASTCECALRHVDKTSDLDLVILDYRLPDMCGMEVLKEVKKMMPSVPVIVITGFGDEDIAVQSLRLGARDYLKKPFDIDELQKRIEFCLSLKARGEDSRESLLFDGLLPGSALRFDSVASSDIHKIQKAVLFVDANYAANISRSIVARHAGLSTRQFSRLFKMATGLTYQEYLKILRIEKAKELLKNDCKATITGVAQEVGYADLTHFERDFKKLVGISPKCYRTLHSDPKKAQ